jgi:PLP dependent protein
MEKHISENIREVLARIEAAAMRSGRDPYRVTLLAATKNRSAEEVDEAAGAGIRVAGENRVQELLAKMDSVRAPVEWHFIGHLQRNKARQVVGRVGLVHSVDSSRLAEELSRRSEEAGVVQAVLLQVNVAGEESKSGFGPEELEAALGAAQGLPGIDVRGLSTIAPLVDDPEEVRWVFKRLAGLGQEFRALGLEDAELSMGMTNDFEVAVEEGSTFVRIGTAIFGQR